jgi:hypothetical protein
MPRSREHFGKWVNGVLLFYNRYSVTFEHPLPVSPFLINQVTI